MKILLLAGEESGLHYAQGLQENLRRQAHESLTFRTYQSEGFRTEDLAVFGFFAVVRKIFYFWHVFRTMKRVIRTWKPDRVVTIDYPGLNLKIAHFAHTQGIPAIHMVCPQVWAWHQSRIPRIARSLSKLLCFFPFEPELFKNTSLEALFIGHPLVDEFRAEQKDVVREKELVAVLPGSRLGEVQRILPRLLPALEGLNYRIPAANEKVYHEIVKYVPPRCVQHGGARALLLQAHCAVVASGTATLEAALAQCPTVLVYAVSPLLARFLRWAIRSIHYVGLINIVWEKSHGTGEAPMVELLQEAFTSQAVQTHVRTYLTDECAYQAVCARVKKATDQLISTGDALARAAREILDCKWLGRLDSNQRPID